jgi:hypothetical protein
VVINKCGEVRDGGELREHEEPAAPEAAVPLPPSEEATAIEDQTESHRWRHRAGVSPLIVDLVREGFWGFSFTFVLLFCERVLD